MEVIRNKVNRIRHWKFTSLGKRRPKQGFHFTLMTYNILSQAALESHPYLYIKCHPEHLAEEYRIARILPEILKSRSDVVCLQEVEQHLYDRRIRGVVHANGFSSLFKKRTGSKSDGCAILWRRDKFSLVAHREVELRRWQRRDRECQTGGSGGIESDKSTGCGRLDRDNVGLIAVLRPADPRWAHHQLHVATTHLLFNPRRGDVKLLQLRLLLAELQRSALKKRAGRSRGGEGAEREYHPTVLCGDFNFEPHSPLYAFVEEGRIDVSDTKAGDLSGQREGRGKGGALDGAGLSLETLGIDASGRFVGQTTPPTTDPDDCPASELFYHDFQFAPAYRYNGPAPYFPVSSMTGSEFNTVDHIFYSVRRKTTPTSVEEGGLCLLGVYALPQREQLGGVECMPNAYLGSDHLCLQSRFILR